MEASVLAVERIFSYSLKNKKLLEEALTHSSYTDSASYERLEFIGDSAISLAISNYFFLAYPDLHQGQLSSLRAANISTEKLARVAVRHGLYQYVRRNAAALDEKIIRGLLEPIYTPEDLQVEPQPVTVLFEVCQKNGKQVDIKNWRNGSKNVASVYVDGSFVASGSSMQKEIARLNAAREALIKLSESMITKITTVVTIDGIDESFEIEGAKQKLHDFCCKKKWPKPNYSTEKDLGPSHERKFVCSVKIARSFGILYIMGDEKSRLRDAENSAASLMIRALQEKNYL